MPAAESTEQILPMRNEAAAGPSVRIEEAALRQMPQSRHYWQEAGPSPQASLHWQGMGLVLLDWINLRLAGPVRIGLVKPAPGCNLRREICDNYGDIPVQCCYVLSSKEDSDRSAWSSLPLDRD